MVQSLNRRTGERIVGEASREACSAVTTNPERHSSRTELMDTGLNEGTQTQKNTRSKILFKRGSRTDIESPEIEIKEHWLLGVGLAGKLALGGLWGDSGILIGVWVT